MSNIKNASTWQETKARIRQCYLQFGGVSRSIQDVSFEGPNETPHRSQWSPKDIKSFIRATKLCVECSGVFKGTQISGCDPHHDSYDSLLRCAESGCRICVGLAGRVQKWLFAEETRYLRNNPMWTWWSNSRSKRIHLFTRFWPSTSFHFDFLIGASACAVESELQLLWTLSKVKFSQLDLFINPAPTSCSPDPSPAANWVKVCTGQFHEECQNYRRRAGQSLQRPSRLLQLCDNQPEVVRLIEGLNVPDDPYVTLSHRWGNPDPPKLSAVRDNGDGRISIPDLNSGVHISILPRTFRDALNIVLRCGLRHLWIDSLCILQDRDADGKNPDWEMEAAKIGDIYAGAVFNIVALNGSNSDGGLFPKQQRLLFPVIQNPGVRRVDSTTSYVLCDDDEERFNGAIMDSELLSRGWVFQEVLLAPANLFCTSEQMWWSCSHASFSQTFPRGRPEDFDLKKLVADGLRTKKQAIMVPDDCKDPMLAWTQALMHYTKTSVTFGKDRLPAIIGIANTFRALFPTTFRNASYHSGVWSTQILRQLGWHRDPNSDIPLYRFVTNHYMPSWSPSSFSGPSLKYSAVSKEALPIEVIKLDTSDLDSFGRARDAKHGVLHLRGVLVEMSLDHEDEKLAAWPTNYPRVKVDVCWDNLEETRSAREAGASYRALALYYVERRNIFEGLLLRKSSIASDSGDEDCNTWVRCAWFSWNLSLYGSISRHEYEAFQFGRYFGLTWFGKHEPTNLEDILIV